MVVLVFMRRQLEFRAAQRRVDRSISRGRCGQSLLVRMRVIVRVIVRVIFRVIVRIIVCATMCRR